MDINAFIATMPGRGLPGFFGGIALILGLATRYVAALLLLFVIIATLSSHRYWEFAEAAPPRAQDNNFSKNLAINARGGQERTGETLTKAASSGPAQPAPLLGPCHLAPCSGGACCAASRSERRSEWTASNSATMRSWVVTSWSARARSCSKSNR